MSDTCIVCLGDLSSAAGPAHRYKTPTEDSLDEESTKSLLPPDKAPVDELIAHLLPCGHDLHDECLRPWVERANSCPICRQSFNSVDLTAFVGGPVQSSYTVEDRVQVADIDPSMLIDDDDLEDAETEVCVLCGHADGESLFIFCDGCDLAWHLGCTGLESVPRGDWFCHDCTQQCFTEPVTHNSPTSSRSRPRSINRSAGQGIAPRRRRNTRPQVDREWSRVWRYVATELDFDLEFPFEDDGSLASNRTFRERQTQEQWRQRLLIAERNGVARRFRARAPIPNTREKPDVSEPESQEELRAWNAMEKAKDLEENPHKRKRERSATASPVEAQHPEEPERKLKRPRTRRTIDPLEAVADVPAAPSRGRAPSLSGPSTAPHPPPLSVNENSSEPSFLQSLLKEVESSSKPHDSSGLRPHLLTSDHPSPMTFTSPGSSPTTSNYPSPRASATTPPSHLANRPGSPTFLSSKIEPIFSHPEFSPSRSPRLSSPTTKTPRKVSDLSETRSSRSKQSVATQTIRPRAVDSSPSRANMSLELKSEISKMVGAALKPYYHDEKISKEDYTVINRDVSRMLYDKIGDTGTLDQSTREEWEKMATDESSKAVKMLKSYGGYSDR